MASEQAVAAAMAVWGIGDWSDALEAAFPIMLRDKMNGRGFTREDVAWLKAEAEKIQPLDLSREYDPAPPSEDEEKLLQDRKAFLESLADSIEFLLPPEGT